MILRAIMFSAAATFAATTGTLAADDWIMVGKRTVKDRVETDTITLSGHRLFSHIKICVYRKPVHFIDADIHYDNGGHQDVPLARRINAGDCSRVIDLNGGVRDIDRIVLRYEETSRKRARATVRVFAK